MDPSLPISPPINMATTLGEEGAIAPVPPLGGVIFAGVGWLVWYPPFRMIRGSLLSGCSRSLIRTLPINKAPHADHLIKGPICRIERRNIDLIL